MRWRQLFEVVLVGSLTTGCELVATFDRSNIGQGDRGAGGAVGGGATSTTTAGAGGTTCTVQSCTTATVATTGTPTVDECTNMADCSACETSQECVACCSEANADSNVKFITYLVSNCACMDMATCQMACAPAVAGDPDICMDPTGPTTQACVDCINGQMHVQGACVMAATQACGGDSECMLVLQCHQGCQQ